MASIENTGRKDALVLNVQDPFQRLLLHGVCEVNMCCHTFTTSFLWKNSNSLL
jgi:hypothetical protein